MGLPSSNASLTSSQCVAVLKAIGDETRLRIVELLLLEDQCVSKLALRLHSAQPHVSHHLRILRDAGLVEGLRDGKRVCYRITPGVRRALANRQGRALNLGCCEVRFPESAVLSIGRSR